MSEVIEGKKTSEYEVAEKAGFLATVAMVAGVVVTLGAPMVNSLSQVFGTDAKVVAICGVILSVAGVLGRALASLGYSKARADVKVAASLAAEKPSE